MARDRPVPAWASRREHAGGLTHGVRSLLTLLAVVGISLGVFAILKEKPAEAGGTAILIGAIVILLLALVGRFPDKLSGGGWELEFRPDTIREILALVQSESPELATRVEELVRKGTRPSDATKDVLKSVGEDRAADISFETRAREAVRALPGLVNLELDVEIAVPSAGRRPIVDAKGNLAGKTIIFEIKSTWTTSVEDFTSRRLYRALSAEDIDIAVLIVAIDDVARATTSVDNPRVLVTSLDEIHAIPARIKNLKSL